LNMTFRFRERDRGFESVSLQRGVCLRSEPRGCRRKAPHFGGALRVAGDVRRDLRAANRRSLGVFLYPALMQSHLLKVQTVCNDARPRWGPQPLGISV
jgi:hypothetical protein